MKDSWQGRTKEFAKPTFTPSFKGTPVAKPKNFYKNLTNVKGKVSTKKREVNKILKKKGFSTNYSR